MHILFATALTNLGLDTEIIHIKGATNIYVPNIYKFHTIYMEKYRVLDATNLHLANVREIIYGHLGIGFAMSFSVYH